MPAVVPAEEDYEYEAVSKDPGSGEGLVNKKEEALAGSQRASARQKRVEAWRPMWRRLGMAMLTASAALAVGGGVASLGLPRLFTPPQAAPYRPMAEEAPAAAAADAAPAAAAAAAAAPAAAAAVAAPAAVGPAAAPAARPLMTAHDVANALSAYAQLGKLPAETEFDTIQQRAGEVVGDMSAKDVSRTLDAYARMKKPPEDHLLTALGLRAQQVVGDMDAQDVTDTINAYAELEGQIAALPGEMPPQELSLAGGASPAAAMAIAEAP